LASVGIVLSPPVSFILKQSGAFRAALMNLQPLWERLKPVASAIEEEQWATEGQGSWPGGPDYHGMIRTGDLKSSLVDPGRAVQSEGPQEMVWGSDVFYAIFHHAGMGNNPVRLLVDVSRGQAQSQIEPVVVSWVNEVAAQTWGAI